MGELLILDNGAYEGQQRTDCILDGIDYYDPDVVALPDYLLESWEKTWEASQRFLDLYHSKFPHVEWMYVPQSTRNNIMGFIDGLYHALNDSRIGWIGLPRAMCTHISMDPLIRANCAQWLRPKRVKVHALGMVRGNLGELPFLREAGVFSIDSSAPVWRGWNGISLEETSGRDCVPDVDFDASMDNVDHQTITRNLEACGVNTNSSIPTR